MFSWLMMSLRLKSTAVNPLHPEAGLSHFLLAHSVCLLSPVQAVPVWIPAGIGNIHHGRFCLECCRSHSGATVFPLPSSCRLERLTDVGGHLESKMIYFIISQKHSSTGRDTVDWKNKNLFLLKYSKKETFLLNYRLLPAPGLYTIYVTIPLTLK